MAIDPALQRFVAMAVADLSARAAVSDDEIVVVRAEATTWSDTSLGCPQPGMRYAQVPQDGARIIYGSATNATDITPVAI